MDSNTKSTQYLVVGVLVIAAIFFGWYLRGSVENDASAVDTEISGNSKLASIGEEDARNLLDCHVERQDGRYVSCDITIEHPVIGGQTVIAEFHGLFDDSVAESRTVARIVFENGTFKVIEKNSTFRCHVGRGHQDFSTEPCI